MSQDQSTKLVSQRFKYSIKRDPSPTERWMNGVCVPCVLLNGNTIWRVYTESGQLESFIKHSAELGFFREMVWIDNDYGWGDRPFEAPWNRRATGRTARMIMNAIEKAMAGKKVVIVTESIGYSQDIFRKLHYEMMSASDSNQWGEVRFIEANNGHVKWSNNWVSIPGIDGETFLLVDHSAIERRFRQALEMFHRFDISSIHPPIQSNS